jgi:hypothetical protein
MKISCDACGPYNIADEKSAEAVKFMQKVVIRAGRQKKKKHASTHNRMVMNFTPERSTSGRSTTAWPIGPPLETFQNSAHTFP